MDCDLLDYEERQLDPVLRDVKAMSLTQIVSESPRLHVGKVADRVNRVIRYSRGLQS